jgi:hypothetical protein
LHGPQIIVDLTLNVRATAKLLLVILGNKVIDSPDYFHSVASRFLKLKMTAAYYHTSAIPFP